MSLTSRLRRAAVAALSAAALAGAGLVGLAAPAQAAACTSTSSGVTVVVSFPGGSTSVRCAPGDPASGAAALQAAGFSITQVQTQPGFVCRIDGAPASDPCVRTPPTTAYWTYWSAKPGGSWSYNSTGAYSFNPAAGSVEGWAFGAGVPPAIAPPAVSAPAPPPPPPSTTKPAPKPSTSKPAPKPSTSTTKPAPKPSTSTSASRPSASAPGPAATTGSPATASPTESATATDPATESATASESPTAEVSEMPTEETHTGDAEATNEAVAAGVVNEDSGSSGGMIAGLGVVGVLLGAAGWMGWRRRAAS